MSIRYKIEDAKKNKNLINDEIKVSRVKSGGGLDGTPTKKQKSTRDLLVEFMGEQREFNTRIEKEVLNLRNDFNIVVKLNNLRK